MLEVPSAHKNLIDNSILLTSFSIIGVGHLGSDVAYSLADLGVPELYLYDNQKVETRNISGTPYLRSHLDQFKTDALKSILEESNWSTKAIKSVSTLVTNKHDLVEQTSFYLIATDSIESRLEIFDAICLFHDFDAKPAYLIDMRSRSLLSEVYGIALESEVARYWYSENLKAKLGDTSEDVHCNEANIIYNTRQASCIVNKVVSDVLEGDRSLRFYHVDVSELKIMQFKIPLNQFVDELEQKKLKKPCKYCGRKHRSKQVKDKCQAKHKDNPSEVKETKTKLPDRGDLF